MKQLQKIILASTAVLLTAQFAVAGVPPSNDVPLGRDLGVQLGEVLSSVLPEALPGGIGGTAGIAALALVVGAQLIKRRK